MSCLVRVGRLRRGKLPVRRAVVVGCRCDWSSDCYVFVVVVADMSHLLVRRDSAKPKTLTSEQLEDLHAAFNSVSADTSL